MAASPADVVASTRVETTSEKHNRIARERRMRDPGALKKSRLANQKYGFKKTPSVRRAKRLYSSVHGVGITEVPLSDDDLMKWAKNLVGMQ